MSFSDSPLHTHIPSFNVVHTEHTPEPSEPFFSATPLNILIQEAAKGRRGAAWRLLHLVIENDPRAMMAVSSSRDPRIVRHLLEFIALGTWAGKSFNVPLALHSPYARTHLCTLFVPPSGLDEAISEQVLLPALHDARPALRKTAIHLLGIMGSKAALPALIADLDDPAPDIRQQAIKALGHIGSPDAIPALLHTLHHSDEQQGNQIFQALVNLGDIAVPSLLEVSQSHSTWMRWNSIRALGEIHDGRALPRLVQALADPDHGVVWMAAKSLALFGRACIEPVLQLLTTTEMTPWLAETASYVLSRHFSGYEELQPFLDPVIQQMQHAVYRAGTCYTALKALQRLQASGLLHQPN